MKIEKTKKVAPPYWAVLAAALLMAFTIESPIQDHLPVLITNQQSERLICERSIWSTRELYVAEVGRNSELRTELWFVKAEACIRYKVESMCWHDGSDLRDWSDYYYDVLPEWRKSQENRDKTGDL